MNQCLSSLCALGFLCGTLVAADPDVFYVDPAKGADTNPGTAEQPWKTLQFADSKVKPGSTVLLAGGIYRDEFKPTTSGADGKPITYKAADVKNPPIFEGGTAITGWKKHDEKKNIWVADFTSASLPSALFQDEQKMLPAQWPTQSNPEDPYNLEEMFEIKEAGADLKTDVVDPEHLCQSAGTFDGGILVHFAVSPNGICFKKIVGHDPEKGILKAVPIEGEFGSDLPFQDPAKGSRKDRYAIRNCMFALDARGEWFVDSKTKPFKIYLIPFAGKDPNQTAIIATARTHAITSAGKDLSNVVFDGLTFRHFHDAAHLYRRFQAVITLTGGKDAGKVSNITIRNCAIYHNYPRAVTNLQGDDFLIENNHLWGNEMTVNTGVFHIVRGKNARFIQNHIHHNVSDGIWAGTGGGESRFAVDGIELRGNLVHDNESRKIHSDGLQTVLTDNIVLIDNYFFNSTAGSLMWLEGSGKITFIRNYFGNSYLGVNDAREFHAFNNVFDRAWLRLSAGAEYYCMRKYEFRNNVVFHSIATAPKVLDWKILESVVSDHNYYYETERGTGPYWVLMESYDRLKEKLPEGTRKDGVWLQKAVGQRNDTYGFALSPTSIDGKAAQLSPEALFVNPEKHDFHLKDGSPLINAGIDVGQPFNGKAPDIGMFEAQ